MLCTIELTTDRHEASRGLFATAELQTCIMYYNFFCLPLHLANKLLIIVETNTTRGACLLYVGVRSVLLTLSDFVLC